MVGLYYLLVAAAILVAGFLFYLAIQIHGMGVDKLARKADKAKRLLDKGKAKRALRVLYKALAANGWDYEGYLARKKTNKLAMIRDVDSRMVRFARAVRILPKDNLEWTTDAFFLLADVYAKLNNEAERARLFADLSNFLEDYGANLSRVDRSRMLSKISAEQAKVEFGNRNYRSAIHFEIASFLYLVEFYQARGDLARVASLTPYRPTELLRKILAEQGREGDVEEVSRLVQSSIVDNGARIDWVRVTRDLDDFFKGRLTLSARDREMAQMIYKKVLEKATDQKPGPKGGSDDNVIHL